MLLLDTPPPVCTPQVIVLASGKGGCGRTTTALALAASWRDAGHRVALLDLDPQAGATLAAGVRPPADPVRSHPVEVHGFRLWPAGRALAAAAATQLSDRLSAARRGADVVIADLSPALTDAGHAAAVPAADLVAVVARLDAAGLPHVEEVVDYARAHSRPWRIVPTFRAGTRLSGEAETFLRGRFDSRVTQAVVPTDARAAEAPSRRAPVTDTARRARVTVAVRALADELLGVAPSEVSR